jgi:SAM-dependent methyltransferase
MKSEGKFKPNRFSSREVQDFWDQAAEVYDRANDRVRAAHDQRYTESFKYFPASAPPRILNVWSRTGEGLEFLRTQKISSFVLNLEASFRMIQKAKDLGREGHYVQTSLTELPVQSGSMDLVLSLETLEHCPNPQKFLLELRRVLKKDGALILSCPPAFAEIVLWIYERFAANHGEGPHAFPSSALVKKLLAHCGFELLAHRGTLFFPFAHPWAQKIDGWLEKTLNPLGLSDLGIRQFYHAKKIGE